MKDITIKTIYNVECVLDPSLFSFNVVFFDIIIYIHGPIKYSEICRFPDNISYVF